MEQINLFTYTSIGSDKAATHGEMKKKKSDNMIPNYKQSLINIYRSHSWICHTQKTKIRAVNGVGLGWVQQNPDKARLGWAWVSGTCPWFM